ncbi:hypothetical protein MLD38_013254 [Melastoma candidum]|uniref:Uncharacterized protein n=1 Tax=Melastoma candidum TaxID=119954 RepID=A0ACB9R904_9MYRT|nr:hypothetical protein MLD38_013254 [Melastoma candidum]
MFNSQSLSRNGPLGAVWVAAYCHKRLKKLHVTQTDIPSSVDKMLLDELDVIAYRVLAYFLLGIVRIYSKKVEYLFKDCHKVLVDLKGFVFKEPNVSRTKHRSSGKPESHGSVSIPKRFELDAFDLEVVEEECSSRGIDKPLEEITLRDHNCGDSGAAQFFTGMHQWQDLTTCYHPCSPGHISSEEFLQSDMVVDEVGIICDVVVEVGRVHDVVDDAAVRNSDHEVKEMSIETFLNYIPDHGEGSYLSTLDRFGESFPNPVPLNEDEQVNGEERVDMEGLIMEEENSMGNEEPESSVNQKERDLPEEREDDLLFDGAEDEPLELVNTPGKELVSESIEMDKSPGDVLVNKKGIPVVSSPPQLPVEQGTTKPETITIQTPNVKEHVQKKRKRSCLCDDTIVLSNKELRRNLADTSGLGCRRKTVPENVIAIWKTSRTRNVSILFSEPVISGMSPGLMSLFYPPTIKTPQIQEGTTPQEKETQEDVGGFEKANILESPGDDGPPIEPKGLAPNTPAQRPLSRRPFESPVGSSLDATRVESNENEQELEYSLNIEEIAPCEADNRELNSTTERTRTVAKFLHVIFVKLKKGAEDEVLSLSKLSKGKTRKYTAKLFYEILVLKSKGCIVVEQGHPYDDIMIKKGPELEQALEVQ